MNLLQRRQPRGVPTGGQFSVASRHEGTVDLSTAPTAASTATWYPALSDGVDQALTTLGTAFAPNDETFPASEHAVAMGALHDLADALLDRHGVVAPYRSNDELVDLRTTVAEQMARGTWAARKRDLVVSALGDVALARKADRLARASLGRYDDNVVHFLMALETSRREAP